MLIMSVPIQCFRKQTNFTLYYVNIINFILVLNYIYGELYLTRARPDDGNYFFILFFCYSFNNKVISDGNYYIRCRLQIIVL